MADATRKTGQRVVVALGGNAILQPGQVGADVIDIHEARRASRGATS